MEITVGLLCDRFSWTTDGSLEASIEGVCGLDDNLPEHLSFIANPQLMDQAQHSKIKVFLTKESCPIPGKINLFCSNPSLAMIECSRLFQRAPYLQNQGIHPTAIVGESAELGTEVMIGAHVTIGENVHIGRGTQIYPNVTIMDRVKIGENCRIFPQVMVGESCQIGNRVIVHSGTVIGSDGYGFYFYQDQHLKIPQLGIVVIEDDVELGANCAVDRGRFTETRIGRGSKLDNLVHIAHNVRVGELCLLTAQTGIAGSAEVGNRVSMGGQSGIVGHVTVASGTTLYAKSLLTKSTLESGEWAGIPARPMKLWQKAVARFYRSVR